MRVEQEIKIPIELPAIPSAQCEATAESEYQQRNTLARLISTIAVAAFPYFLMMVVAVLLIWFFPELVTFLPSQMKL